jgi:hypothetical protein
MALGTKATIMKVKSMVKEHMFGVMDLATSESGLTIK